MWRSPADNPLVKLAAMISGFHPFLPQEDGLRFFDENDGQAVLSWGTGTGKTAGSLYVLETSRERGRQLGNVLVVVPTGLRENYAKAVRRFTDQTVQVLGSQQEVSKGQAVSFETDQPAGYNVIGFEVFRKDPEGITRRLKANTLVVDEAHKSKNELSATYKSLMAARGLVQHSIVMTASESSNEPADIIPLLDIAYNGRHPFGSRKDFRSRFEEKSKDKSPTGYRGKLESGASTLKNVPELTREIGRYVHYVDSSALNAEDFPKKDIEVEDVPMSGHQAKLYEYAMRQVGPVTRALIRNGAPADNRDIPNVSTEIALARAVSNSIAVLDENVTLDQAAEQTPKIRRVLDNVQQHLQSTPDGQVVVFTNLIEGGADVLSAGLKARHIPFGLFLGKQHEGSDEASRQQAVRDYNERKVRVLVVSGAGAEGLDLPDTTQVHIVDGHFNPERIRQAMARGVRAKGLSKRIPERREVEIRMYNSVLPHSNEPTVDQWVYTTAQKKLKPITSFRQVLKASNPGLYERAQERAANLPVRLPSKSVPAQKVQELGPSATSKLPSEFTPAKGPRHTKYIRRWKGPDGEWRYEYARSKTAALELLARLFKG